MTSVHAGGKTLKEVMTLYNSEMVDRTKVEMELSVRNAYMLHDWETLSASPLALMHARKGNAKDVANGRRNDRARRGEGGEGKIEEGEVSFVD